MGARHCSSWWRRYIRRSAGKVWVFSWLRHPRITTLYHRSYLALGANVIAAAGSQAKLEICTKYGGADYCVDYTKKDWQKEVLKITGGKGVDVVYDPVGLIAGQSIHSEYIIRISSLLDRLS